MRYLVLGPMLVESGDGEVALGGPKQRAVLAMLVVARGRPVPVEHIVDGVWGESPPAAVRTSIHSYVSNLRIALQGGIERTGGAYRLDVGPDDVDAGLFERLVDEGSRLVATNAPVAAVKLREALSLWRGRPYSDLVDVPGLDPEIRRLEALRITAVEARIDADLTNGRHGALIGELEALTAEHPYHEGFRARHMLALYRDGRQTEALRAYRTTRDVLVEELGVDPSPELQSLEHRILTHDPDLLRDTDTATQRVAFLAVDASLPSEIWELEPEAARATLEEHDRALGEALDRFGGRLFRRSGDTTIAAFADVRSAARAAVELHRTLADTAAGSHRLGLRMAIDEGEVEVQAGEFQGPPVLRALRFMAAGHDGQVLLTAAGRDALGSEAGVQILNLGEHRFRGLGEPVPAYQLVADGLATDFPALRTDAWTADLARGVGDAIRGYELREEIGSGRFGVVYRAYQPSVGREVAIKVIRSEYANHPEFVRRFESEARLVAKLEHPHIVTLLDFWRDHEGAYFVMPYMTGGSLADATGDPMPAGRALRLLRQIGSALQYAHREGVIHRDIKPANLLLDSEGNVYVSDFGIAMPALKRIVGLETTDPTYRAPEDRAGHAIDQRVDVYSMGAVAARLMTGAFPNLSGLELLTDQQRGVLRRALAERPEERQPSVGALLEGLEKSISPPSREMTKDPIVAVRNPYKGLAPFDVSDARDFFGREAEISQLVELVAGRRFVTVVGPSGSGKSSLVRAGLVPALAAAKPSEVAVWTSVVMTPGRHPFEALGVALAQVASTSYGSIVAELRDGAVGVARCIERVAEGSSGDLVLILDQFEELYLLADDAVRDEFTRALGTVTDEPRSRLRVVVTIRADFFDRPLADSVMAPRIQAAHLVVGTPGDDHLTAAIVKPAELAGVRFEPGLADRIVADVRNQPGTLPLMQYVLSSLVEASVDGAVSTNDYAALGGVSGAVGRAATAIYESFDAGAATATQQVFLRLVAVTEDADDVRRRVHLSELRDLGITRGVLDQVLDAYGDARLLTFDLDPVSRSPTVEVAHEALLREWPLLRSWIAEHREFLTWRNRLHSAHEAWLHSGRDRASVLRGLRLGEARHWLHERGGDLSSDEREFIEAGLASERRSSRLRSLALVLVSAIAVAAVFFAFRAVVAADEARSLYANALIGDAQFLLSTGATEDAAVGLTESFALDPSPDALVVMGEIVNGHQVWGTGIGERGGAEAAILAVDWERGVVATAGERSLRTLTLDDGGVVDEFELDSPVTVLVFMGSGVLVSGDEDGAVRVWNIEDRTSSEIATFESAVADIAVVSDEFLVAASAEIAVAFEHSESGWQPGPEFPVARVGVEPADRAVIRRVAVSHDDRLLVTTGSPLLVAWWDLNTGELIASEHAPTGRSSVWAAQFAPDDSYLVTGIQDRTLRVYDVASYEGGVPTEPVGGQQRSVSFTPDGRHVVSTGQNGILVWTFADGLLGTSPTPLGVTTAFSTHEHSLSPDGTRVVTAVEDRVRLHDIAAGLATASTLPEFYWKVAVDGSLSWIGGQTGLHWWHRSTGDSGQHKLDDDVLALAPSSDGGVYFGTGSGTIGLATERNHKRREAHEGRVLAIARSPDGHTIVSVGVDNRLGVWETDTLRPLVEPLRLDSDSEFGLKDVAFRDDSTAVIAGGDGVVRVWDLENREEASRVTVSEDQLNAVAVLASGAAVLGDETGTMFVVDLDLGAVEHEFAAHTAAIRGLALSPDGATLASAGQDNTVRLWSVETWDEVGVMHHPGAVRSVAFYGDGDELIAVGQHGSAVVWDAGWRQWPQKLCDWLGGWDLQRSWAVAVGDTAFDPTCAGLGGAAG